MSNDTSITIEATDVSGQKAVRVRGIPCDSSIGELIDSLINRLGLPDTDAEGRPLNFEARLEREGRALRRGEAVGDALADNDRVMLQPEVTAG